MTLMTLLDLSTIHNVSIPKEGFIGAKAVESIDRHTLAIAAIYETAQTGIENKILLYEERVRKVPTYCFTLPQNPYNNYSISIAVSSTGQWLLAGCPYEDIPSGIVYLYRRRTSDRWVQKEQHTERCPGYGMYLTLYSTYYNVTSYDLKDGYTYPIPQ